MEDFLQRLRMLYGNDKVELLKKSKVAVFGVGGVGGYVVESLARSGIGTIALFDNDTVAVSNINRQIIATTENIGELKVIAAQKRIKSINPECKVQANNVFYAPDNSDDFDFSQYDFVVDAIDFVPGKISLAVKCNELNIPIISAMGAGNKIHPEMLELTDLYKTSVCPLARVMRRELKKRNVKKLPVVYSKEEPIKPNIPIGEKLCPGSCAFVPSAAGLIISGYIINKLTGMID